MKKTITLIGSVVFGLTLVASAHCGGCEKKDGDKAGCDAGKCEESCEAKMEKAFSTHDADKDGKLTLIEFKALVKAMKAEKEGNCDGGKCDKANTPVKAGDCDGGTCDKAKEATTAAITK